MDLTRQEYPNLLTSLQPGQAVNVLNDRVKLISKVNADIADWLSERRKVEEAYAHGLRNLARRPQQDGASALGIFQTPWQRIVASAEDIAQSHENFAAKIDTDVETPLRQWAPRNREMQSMSTIQRNLSSVVNELESAQRKADKLRNRPDRSANASDSIDDAQSQWDSQAPYVFEQLQAADETRLNHLRDVLTQYQTHEADKIERSRATTEQCLNALLTIETADEIKTFAARTLQQRPSIPTRDSSGLGTSAVTRPDPPPPRGTDPERARLGPTLSQDRLKPEKESPRHSAFGGGIRRLGTVMGRRKSQLPPPQQTDSPEKPKKSRGLFRREDSSRSFQQVESPPATARDLSPVTSHSETLTPQPSVSQALQEPLQPHSVTEEAEPEVEETQPAPYTNGTTSPFQPTQETSTNFATPSETPAERAPPRFESIAEEPTRLDPISQAQQEANTYSGENEDALRSLKIQDQPIQEDESEAREALDSLATQLRMQARQSGLRPQSSIRGRRDVRNTIYVPNPEPIQASNGITGGLSAGALADASPSQTPGSTTLSPMLKRAVTGGTIPEDRASDANSIHSSHTLSSVSGAFAHPDLHEPGLNASIIETVNTWFTDGAVSKSFAIGEVALAYNPKADGDHSPNETIRLENFQMLEKVAANPAFVMDHKGKAPAGSDDNAGEYSLILSPITKPTPTVGFKYQLHLDAASPSMFSPLVLSPAWQVQDSQASVIIAYSLNPAFTLPEGTGSVTFRNFALTVSLDVSGEAGKAVQAMMGPIAGASFKKKQSAIVWKLPELVVESGVPNRFLARFITAGPAPKAGHIEAKWELQGSTGSSLGVSAMSGASADVDPFADESAGSPTKTWTAIPVTKKLVTGRYSA